jgi:hypothetical protein
MSREKTELDAMRMQRDDLLMLLRRLIYVVSKKNESATADLIKRANDYMERKCPPPRIVRAMDGGASEVAAGLEPEGDSDEPPSGSCEYCGVDVWDNHELCDQCEWWVKQ